MSPGGGSTVRRRRLARELKRLREEAGFSVEAVADELGLGRNTVYRYESGRSRVRVGYVRLLLDLYGSESPERDTLLTIARESAQKGWWTPYEAAMPEGFQVYVELEAEAVSLREYEPSCVPGLLQTEDYARALMRAGQVGDNEDRIDQWVALRMARQAVLAREEAPLQLWAILDEAVLRRPVGGPVVMRTQLDRLVEAGRLPNVTIQVLPFAHGAHPAMEGSLAILEFPDPADSDVGYIEGRGGIVFEEEAGEVRRSSMVFDHLRAAALPTERAAELVAAAGEETTRSTHEGGAG